MLFMLSLFRGVAFGCIIWALWNRRSTWTSSWEYPVTLAIALQGVGLFLVSPIAVSIPGDAVRHLTGQAHLPLVVGHGFLIAGAALIAYGLISRLMPDRELRRMFTVWIQRPSQIATVVLLILFAAGGLGEHHVAGASTAWSRAYWSVFSGVGLYLLGVTIAALLRLRRYSRHRATADLYLIACAGGIVCQLSRFVCHVVAGPDSHWVAAAAQLATTASAAVWLGGTALTASSSWRRKVRELYRPWDSCRVTS